MPPAASQRRKLDCSHCFVVLVPFRVKTRQCTQRSLSEANDRSGCSGSLFGIISLVCLDLLYTWGSRKNPIRDLLFLVLVIAVEVVIGLLPTGLDNFSHIGGLLMGFVLGISILHSPNALRKHYEDDAGTFNQHLARDQQRHKSSRSRSTSKRHKTDELIYGTQGMDASAFVKHPLSFFKGRKPLWWVWWLFRAAATVTVFIGFILLLHNFYNTHKSNCSWCKYMSCLDVNGWCDQGQLKPVATTSSVSGPEQTSAPQRRSFLEI